MAKGPGPIVALLGLGALFMLGGKKGGGGAKPWEAAEAGTEPAPSDKEPPPPPSSGGGNVNQNPPPNLSGDPEGYNTIIFSGPDQVKEIYGWLGYNIKGFNKDAEVRRFQQNYNAARKGGMFDATGVLFEDGTSGKNTLRALEIAVYGKNNPQLALDPDRLLAWEETFA